MRAKAKELDGRLQFRAKTQVPRLGFRKYQSGVESMGFEHKTQSQHIPKQEAQAFLRTLDFARRFLIPSANATPPPWLWLFLCKPKLANPKEQNLDLGIDLGFRAKHMGFANHKRSDHKLVSGISMSAKVLPGPTWRPQHGGGRRGRARYRCGPCSTASELSRTLSTSVSDRDGGRWRPGARATVL